MKHSQNDTVHRVRAVRSWLEKAEASFDEEADIKGELNLMLAEAEMKNLRRHHPRSKGLMRAAACVAAFCLAAGGWYLFHRPAADTLPPPAAVESTQDFPEKEAETVPAEARPAAELPPEEAAPSPEDAPPAAAQPVRTETAEAASAVTESAAPAAAQPRAAVPEKRAVLSDRQVQAAVQDARHTLRGTSITK